MGIKIYPTLSKASSLNTSPKKKLLRILLENLKLRQQKLLAITEGTINPLPPRLLQLRALKLQKNKFNKEKKKRKFNLLNKNPKKVILNLVFPAQGHQNQVHWLQNQFTKLKETMKMNGLPQSNSTLNSSKKKSNQKG